MLIKPSSPQALRLVLVRHAQSDQAADGHDHGLTPHGRRQAETLAAHVAAWPLAAIYSSDVPRAIATAELIAARHPQVPWHRDPDLRELSAHHLLRGLRTEPAARLRVQPGFAAVNRLMNRLLSSHAPQQTVLIVTHGHLIRALVGLPAFGAWSPDDDLLFPTDAVLGPGPLAVPALGTASLTIADVVRGQRPEVMLINDTSYLPPELLT